MAFRGRVGIEVDSFAMQTAIGPTFAVLRRDAEGYGKERAYRIADLAKLFAPRIKEQDPRYYPGELADSIEVIEHGDSEWEIVVGAHYGGFVEFGTSKMRAQPYLRPAVAVVEAESI